MCVGVVTHTGWRHQDFIATRMIFQEFSHVIYLLRIWDNILKSVAIIIMRMSQYMYIFMQRVTVWIKLPNGKAGNKPEDYKNYSKGTVSIVKRN